MLSKLNSLREKNEDGFTLIELLIVVVIIGILAAIAIPIFLNQQKAAIAGTVKSDVRNTVTSVATYLTKNNSATAADLQSVKVGSNAGTGTGAANVIPTVSDSATTISVAGGYTIYTVTGINSNLASSQYKFDSATGQYVGTGFLS